MEVDFVTSQITKKLKEKGYPLLKVKKQNGNPFIYDLPEEHPDWQNCDAWYIPAIWQVLKWFREEKNIHLIVEIADSGWYYTLYPNVRWEDGTLVSDKFIMSFKKNDSYKKAALAGIKCVLDKLI